MGCTQIYSRALTMQLLPRIGQHRRPTPDTDSLHAPLLARMEALGGRQCVLLQARLPLAPFRINAPCASIQPRQRALCSQQLKVVSHPTISINAVTLPRQRSQRCISCSAATTADTGGRSNASLTPPEVSAAAFAEMSMKGNQMWNLHGTRPLIQSVVSSIC